MGVRINPDWMRDIKGAVARGGGINRTVSHNKAAQWLITLLADQNIPFKVYNLGAGVKRITTDIKTCPCCKREL